MAKLLVDERMELKEGRKVVELGRVAPRADHFRLKLFKPQVLQK